MFTEEVGSDTRTVVTAVPCAADAAVMEEFGWSVVTIAGDVC